MKWIGIISIIISVWSGYFPSAYAENYEGLVVQDVQVSCVSAAELAEYIRTHISIQPGDMFSQEKIRESIRNIYALKRFTQITVEAELVEGGVRLSFCPVQIKTISKIQITGNKAVSIDKIRSTLEVNIGDKVSSNQIKAIEQRVRNLYRDQGYPQVQLNIQTIDQPGFEQVIFAIDIQEGESSKIGTIVFSGQTVFSEEELLNVSKLTPGTRFTLERLEEGIERIKKFYAENGYFDVKFTNKDLQYNEETGKAELRLTLDEGKLTRIRFEGNTRIGTKKLESIIKSILSSNGLQEDILAENAEAVAEYYKEKGFPFVKVTYRTLEEDDAPVIIFSIDEGTQVQVERITFTGNRTFSTRQLRKQMFTDTKGIFSKGFYQEKVFQEDILAIKAFYQQQGYLGAEVVSVSKEFSEDQTQVSLSLVIHEGIQTRIADIRIQGEQDEALLKKIRKSLLLKNGKPLNIADVTQSIERIKNLYANLGHINADIDVLTAFNDDNSQVTLTFNIIPGKKFYVGKISIQGVIRTKEVFITRELKIKEGDVYNPQKIRETVRRLNQLGFYDSVTFRRLDQKSDNPVQDMLLAVSETSAKDVEFGVGYSTESEFKGFVEYSDKNVLNYGGKGSTRVDLSIERPKLILQYLHPHLFTQDTKLVASVFDDIQKDNESFEVEKRGGRLALRHNFIDTLSVSLGYYFEQDDPSNVRQDAKLSPLDTKVLNIGGIDSRVSWDIRDDIIQPKKGGIAQLYLRTANSTLGSETDFLELNAQTSWYFNPFHEYVLAFSLDGKLIEPTQSSEYVPIYTRYFLGGDNTVRGFEKYSIGPTAINEKGDKINIGGDRLMKFNTELRFPIYSILGGVIFYDTGANWLDDDGFDSENIRDAIGAGLRIATPVGPLRVDYGWKLDRQSGESAGEYHIAIGSAF